MTTTEYPRRPLTPAAIAVLRQIVEAGALDEHKGRLIAPDGMAVDLPDGWLEPAVPAEPADGSVVRFRKTGTVAARDDKDAEACGREPGQHWYIAGNVTPSPWYDLYRGNSGDCEVLAAAVGAAPVSHETEVKSDHPNGWIAHCPCGFQAEPTDFHSAHDVAAAHRESERARKAGA